MSMALRSDLVVVQTDTSTDKHRQAQFIGVQPAVHVCAWLRVLLQHLTSLTGVDVGCCCCRLRDQWNLRALTHTDGSVAPAETHRALELGAPREQGHYGFMLTDLFLLPLLSGQVIDMAEGKLSLAPMFPAPYKMPLLISNCEGSISQATAQGAYTLEIAFGSLKLPAGGLSVSGVAYEKAVDLEAGGSITWGGTDDAQ
jgi:hypothetical protein